MEGRIINLRLFIIVISEKTHHTNNTICFYSYYNMSLTEQ